MTVSFYLDDDSCETAFVLGLRNSGLDVLIPADAALSGASDEEHLRFATSVGRVLVTYNQRDFQRLHYDAISRERLHAGILLMKQQEYSIGERVRRLQVISALFSPAEFAGHLAWLRDWG